MRVEKISRPMASGSSSVWGNLCWPFFLDHEHSHLLSAGQLGLFAVARGVVAFVLDVDALQHEVEIDIPKVSFARHFAAQPLFPRSASLFFSGSVFLHDDLSFLLRRLFSFSSVASGSRPRKHELHRYIPGIVVD